MVKSLTFNSAIAALAVSQNGRYLAVAQHSDESHTRQVTLWSLPDLQQIDEVVSSKTENFNLLAFTAESQILAFGGYGLLLFYGIDKQTKLMPPGAWGFGRRIYGVKADAENRLVTTAEAIVSSNPVEVYQVVESGKSERLWEKPEHLGFNPDDPDQKYFAKADISPDGKLISVVGTGTEQVLIYDIEQNTLVKTLAGAPLHAEAIDWSPDLRHLAVIGWCYKGVYIWNVETGERVLTDFYNSETRCLSFCFHPSGKYIATGVYAGYVIIRRISDGKKLFRQPLHSNRVWTLAFTPDGQKLITGANDGLVFVLDLHEILPAEELAQL
jgi:WD40 repeat protein